MLHYSSYKEANPVARKSHFCCECGYEILKGDRYNIITCFGSVKAVIYKTCEFCTAIRLVFCTESFTPTFLMEDLLELRQGLSYDDAKAWSELTNAISCVRGRTKRAKALHGAGLPTLSPTPLRGPRIVTGGFAQ